ncbi:MAG: helix-turn-helix transcriptional regulator [Symploca sp. SIO1B1]|nr:helix-turn-helix transcriptional regulator [Symploca sp. SIO1B1]
MAERYLNNKDLMEATGIHLVTISKLKNSQEMPERLERATLDKLCTALKCQPGDLMSWEPDLGTIESFSANHQENKDKKHHCSAIDILDELPGQRLFKTSEEADQYLQEERSKWEN